MADNEILPASCTWVFPTLGIMQFNKTATERAKEDVKSALKTLNDHLLTRYMCKLFSLACIGVIFQDLPCWRKIDFGGYCRSMYFA